MALIFPHFKTFCRLFAVWPYEGTLSYKSVEMYYRCIVFSTNIIAMYAFFRNSVSVINSISSVNNLTKILCFSLLVLVNQFTHLLNRQLRLNILRDCSLVDQELSRLGEEADCKSACVFQTSLIVATLFIHSLNMYLYTSAYNISLVNIEFTLFTIIFGHVQITAMIFMIAGLTQVLKSQFKCINSHVRLLLQDLPTTHPSEVLARSQDLINVHSILRGIVLELNSAYSMNILLLFGYIVMLSSLKLLTLLQNIESGRLEKAIVILCLYEVLKCFILMVVLAETSQSAAYEVCYLSVIINIRY